MATNTLTEQKTLEYWFTAVALGTRPTAWWIELHTGDPGDGVSNVCADASYARQSAVFEVVVGGDGYIARNTGDIVFPAFAAGQTITWVSVKTLVTGGVHIHSAELPVAAVFAPGGIVRIPINALVFNGV